MSKVGKGIGGGSGRRASASAISSLLSGVIRTARSIEASNSIRNWCDGNASEYEIRDALVEKADGVFRVGGDVADCLLVTAAFAAPRTERADRRIGGFARAV